MIARHIRTAGIQFIEAALTKTGMQTISAPTLATLKAKKTRELNNQATATVPKVISAPST